MEHTTRGTLTETDFRKLEQSFIPRDLAIRAGLRRVDSVEGATIVGRQARFGTDYGGLVFPYLWPGETRPRSYRLRRDQPDLESRPDGSTRERNKYLSAPGEGNKLYFPPDTLPADLTDPAVEAHITEGEKKTLALRAFNRATGRRALEIGLPGVWNWRGNVGKATDESGNKRPVKGPIPDLDRIEFNGRRVLIIFDANVRSNDDVFRARESLRRELTNRGAVVYYVDIPDLPGVNGVDDYLAASGPEGLRTLIDQSTAGEPAGRHYYGAEQQDLVPAARRVFEDLAADEAANPTLFWSGGILSRVLLQADQVRVEPLTKESLSYRLAHLGRWYTGPLKSQTDQNLRKYRTPPQSLIRHILATPMGETPFPILTRIVTAPVFTAAGTLITAAGFHRESGIYHAPAFEALPVPETVSGVDVRAAQALIHDIIADFPFAEESDCHNAIGLLLLPFVRDLIDGPTPLHMIEAPVPGSGKGLLAATLLAPALGREGGFAMTQPSDEGEWSKRVTSALMSGKGAIVIDNLRATLASGVLASALTARTWNDRVLGTAHAANVPVRCLWVATGNNPTLSSEIARRCVRIRLEPPTDRPEDRQDFRHKNLLAWVAENRPAIARACHILIRYWLQEGRPAGQQPFGSFESYAGVIGGILGAAGYDKFLANAAAFRERADPERTARAELCNLWWEWARANRGKEFGAPTGEIWENAGRYVEGLPLVGQTEDALRKSFGRYLASSSGVIPTYTDPDSGRTRRFQIARRESLSRGKVLWRIVLVEER